MTTYYVSQAARYEILHEVEASSPLEAAKLVKAGHLTGQATFLGVDERAGYGGITQVDDEFGNPIVEEPKGEEDFKENS